MGNRTLILIDESNLLQMGHKLGRMTDWVKLREFLCQGRDLIETVVYAGLPPSLQEWMEIRQKREKFLNWLEQNGFLVVRKYGKPADEGNFKADVDIMMALDGLDFAREIGPDSVILVTGDGDFSFLAQKLRRRGIWVDVAATQDSAGEDLKVAANRFIDLTDLFISFGLFKPLVRPSFSPSKIAKP